MGILAQVPSLETVEIDAYPGVKKDAPLVMALRRRIEEYEKASTPPVAGRRREGPAFEVIKKQRAPGDKRSPIAELPNGA